MCWRHAQALEAMRIVKHEQVGQHLPAGQHEQLRVGEGLDKVAASGPVKRVDPLEDRSAH